MLRWLKAGLGGALLFLGLLLAMRRAEGEATMLLPPLWGPNTVANTDRSGFAQQEPSLAIHPRDLRNLVVAAKDFRRTQDITREVWIYVSFDGGRSWPIQIPFPGLPPTITRQSDPVALATEEGRFYVLALGAGTPAYRHHGLFLTWSDDGGRTWRDAVTIISDPSTILDDKPWLARDAYPASPYYGRLYVAWRPMHADVLWVVRSEDGGLSWSRPVTAAEGEGVQGAMPVVGADGAVHLFYVEPMSPTAPGWIRVVTSFDGGASFSAPRNVAPVLQPPSPVRAYDRWRLYTLPSAAADPRDPARLYVVWTEGSPQEALGTEVAFARSEDGGRTWTLSRPFAAPGDAAHPIVRTDARGWVHLFWLDRRRDPWNRLFDAFYAYSPDGGRTWSMPFRVSTRSFDLNQAVPPISPAPGDYWGLDVRGDRICAAWSDTRFGDEEIMVTCGILPLASSILLPGIPLE
ncbi:sialidase family protein [Thermoflexus hugenholtzii]|uniref:exo-alpha-sialidase n=1 Tax=Thermoflexus hugenholtzii JAD2 TaxID=877466 RepID=A0A212RRJ1_9CHLR|nr:sialidase family protein [Thermoflexus hugenholtzii]SNB75230.1 BNR repeat-like domain-containing protein [Thermoflexus hugenholtzii JAD2]